jgi:hypothetical protein
MGVSTKLLTDDFNIYICVDRNLLSDIVKVYFRTEYLERWQRAPLKRERNSMLPFSRQAMFGMDAMFCIFTQNS